MKRAVILIAAALAVATPVDATPLNRAMHADFGMSRPKGAPLKWCAWYLDRKLEALGFQGLPSYRARDAVNYGKRAAGFVKGAIAVMRTHITVVDDSITCPKGKFPGTGGNQGKRVKTSCYAKSKVLSLRQPVKASGARQNARKPVIQPAAAKPLAYVTNFKAAVR